MEIVLDGVIVVGDLWEVNLFRGNIGMCGDGLVMEGMG